MKSSLFLLSILLLFSCSKDYYMDQNFKKDQYKINSQIDEMHANDQKIRNSFLPLHLKYSLRTFETVCDSAQKSSNSLPSGKALASLQPISQQLKIFPEDKILQYKAEEQAIRAEMNRIDDENLDKIYEMINKYGYPDLQLRKWNVDLKRFSIATMLMHVDYKFDKKFIHYTNQMDFKKTHCGNINSSYFVINTSNYVESLHHNSCLHKKISIDKDGNIKNCPSMSQSFGNIKNTTLEEAINHQDFKKYWNITKDEIAVCKDCEFRYICTDCRAYTERTHVENDIDLSKPLKCGYNPYTNVWEEWSTNPLKEKAIEYYGFKSL